MNDTSATSRLDTFLSRPTTQTERTARRAGTGDRGRRGAGLRNSGSLPNGDEVGGVWLQQHSRLCLDGGCQGPGLLRLQDSGWLRKGHVQPETHYKLYPLTAELRVDASDCCCPGASMSCAGSGAPVAEPRALKSGRLDRAGRSL
ncbi:unnamed protein product [Periconia digitata]|uniref:Uncharacterized protein n=1 Tax=Periconia digitata TaxID=1303443 RepID=A0A9W4UAU4_9PLEO|nr:unnamed protein product [Periconia digitata]